MIVHFLVRYHVQSLVFFYINDKEMDNVNKRSQRPSSMLSYG